MNTHRYLTLISSFALACLAMPSESVDRVRAGQWTGTWTGAGRTRQTSTCMTQADADALNGDAQSVRLHLEKTIPAEICKLSNFKLNGAEIVYTATCTVGPVNVVKTTYHGDHFESVDSSGARSEAKLIGACK